MRIVAELIGAIFLLGMVGLGIASFIKSWERRQEPTQPPEKK